MQPQDQDSLPRTTAASARPGRREEKAQPPRDQGMRARAPGWASAPQGSRVSRRLSIHPPAAAPAPPPAPGHQPWACGCAPWQARVRRGRAGLGLTHLRASAARRERGEEGAARPEPADPGLRLRLQVRRRPREPGLRGPGLPRGPRARFSQLLPPAWLPVAPPRLWLGWSGQVPLAPERDIILWGYCSLKQQGVWGVLVCWVWFLGGLTGGITPD